MILSDTGCGPVFPVFFQDFFLVRKGYHHLHQDFFPLVEGIKRAIFFLENSAIHYLILEILRQFNNKGHNKYFIRSKRYC